jgi:Core-2/I-Branching enzyme
MNIGYIILVHNNPQQVANLVSTLHRKNYLFFIHVDKSVNSRPFKQYLDQTGFKNILFLKRYKSKWGSNSLLKASLEGVIEAMKHKVDYVVQLSGSDFPIKSNSYIANFLRENKEISFISYYSIPAPYWKPNKEVNRIKKYYFYLGNKLFEYPMSEDEPSLKRRIINIILSFFLPKQRVLPNNLKMYGGEFWFGLSKEACNEILAYSKRTPQLLSFLKYALCPDEIYFQTALLNSNYKKTNVVNRCLTYINWKDKNSPSPEYFIDDDYDNLIQSDALFARKFDPLENSKLMRRIDKYIGQLSQQKK